MKIEDRPHGRYILYGTAVQRYMLYVRFDPSETVLLEVHCKKMIIFKFTKMFRNIDIIF